MTGRKAVESVASVALLVALASSCARPAGAGTTGKLAGRVTDAKKQPLTGANVTLPEVRLGAVTDAEGRYAIFNVPAGTHTVKVRLIGYAPTTITGVVIPADRTTALDATLQEAAVEIPEVVVSARRPVVEVGLTSNVATITRGELARLPVQTIEDVVNLQAGVVDGHFRGGRKDEVQYQVDGITVNNPYDNASVLRLDRSILEELQVISGTFDAEYGQAMSGVVNAVLRRGTERFEWSGEVFGGDFVHPGSARPVDYEFRPGRLQNYQLTLSGPAGLANTLFLLSARRGVKDGYLIGQRRFLEFDTSDPETTVVRLATPRREPIGHTREWLGVAKLTNRSLPNVEVGYQAILNRVDARKQLWDYRLVTDALPRQRTFAAVHGFEWTQTLRGNTFYRLSLRHNHFDYRDMVFDDVWDARYDLEGPLTRVTGFEHGAFVLGVDETRFIQKTDALIFGATASHQLARDHQIKAGIEWQPARVRFGHPGYLVWSGSQYIRHIDEPENGFPTPLTYHPVIGSIYAQDDLEWNDLRFRAGLRFEYFNSKSGIPGDLANPANAIQGVPPVPSKAATRKLTLAPRLGVSYPVTAKASLFFAYGHFYQLPQLGQIFSNADYSVLRELQASSEKDYGVLGNPDVKPEHTIQYQFGYKQALTDWLGLDLTLFYKDIRDLLGSEVITTYNNAEYERLANADFGNVIGFTLSLDQRERGLVTTGLDYTWEVAKGNASDPYETAARRDAKEDARPRQVPLNWDQRHTLNLTVGLARPDDFNAFLALRAVSGQPYTPASETGFGGTLETNSGHKPAALLVDLRGEKSLGRRGGWSVFGRVFNLFDTRFFNGAVFANSGSPYYSRTDTEPDRRDLADPTRYYEPRRVEIGIRREAGR